MRALLHRLYTWAIEQEHVDGNPVAYVRRPGVERQRDRVLSEDEIRTLWKALDAHDDQMAAMFRLRLITAQRGGEVADMCWPDVDLDAGVWTIPAERSKNKLPHRVPLTPMAVRILKALKVAKDALPVTKKDGTPTKVPVYVLAGARGKRQRSEAAATFGLENFIGHDLRRTAASMMAAGGVSRFVVGRVLNHQESGGYSRLRPAQQLRPRKARGAHVVGREVDSDSGQEIRQGVAIREGRVRCHDDPLGSIADLLTAEATGAPLTRAEARRLTRHANRWAALAREAWPAYEAWENYVDEGVDPYEMLWGAHRSLINEPLDTEALRDARLSPGLDLGDYSTPRRARAASIRRVGAAGPRRGGTTHANHSTPSPRSEVRIPARVGPPPLWCISVTPRSGSTPLRQNNATWSTPKYATCLYACPQKHRTRTELASARLPYSGSHHENATDRT